LFGLVLFGFWCYLLKVCLAGFNIVYFDIRFVFVWLHNFWLEFALFWLFALVLTLFWLLTLKFNLNFLTQILIALL